MIKRIFLVSGVLIYYLLVIVAFALPSNSTALWGTLIAIVWVLINKGLYLVNPQKYSNYDFYYMRIKDCEPIFKYLEYSGYIVLVIGLIYILACKIFL